MIDIIHHTFTVANVDQNLHHVDNIFAAQGTFTHFLFTTETTVKLHPPYTGQIITLQTEKQIIEQVFSRFLGRRFAGTHHPVNFYQRFKLGTATVAAQGVRNKWTTVQIIRIDRLNRLQPGFAQLIEGFLGNFSITLKQQLASVWIHQILCQRTTVKVVGGHFELADILFFQLTNMARRDPTPLFNNNLAALALDIKCGDIAPQTGGNQIQ